METYKKPVVTSKSDTHNNIIPIFSSPVAVRKLLGDDDFHIEKSLTPRKNETK